MPTRARCMLQGQKNVLRSFPFMTFVLWSCGARVHKEIQHISHVTAEREFPCEVISAESRNRPKETISAERGSFRPKYEHFWHLISAEMTPKAERFRQLPKLSLSAERPKQGPFGRTLNCSTQADVERAHRARPHTTKKITSVGRVPFGE